MASAKQGGPAPTKLDRWDDPAIMTAIDKAVPAATKGELSRKALAEQLKMMAMLAGKTGYPVLLYAGDTTIDELAVGEWPVVVAGNLTVKGILSDSKGCDSSLLVVLGDLRAGSILTLSEIRVTGAVTASEVVYGNSLGDHTLTAGGAIRGKYVIADGHHFKTPAVESKVAEPEDGWPSVLVPAVLNEEKDAIEMPAFLKHVRAGKPIGRRK